VWFNCAVGMASNNVGGSLGDVITVGEVNFR